MTLKASSLWRELLKKTLKLVDITIRKNKLTYMIEGNTEKIKETDNVGYKENDIFCS